MRLHVIATCAAMVLAGCRSQPARYSVERFTSASDAAKGEADVKRVLAKAPGTAAKPCDAPLQNLSCKEGDMPESIGGGDGWRAHYIEGPLPPFDIHQDPTRFRHKYNLWGIVAALNNDLTMESFTPIQEVRDGERAYEEWGKLAREGQPFGCSAEDCVLIVNVVSPLGEMALAYCTMPKGGSGAPENCWQISVTRGGATWMLAKRGIIIPPGVGGDGEDAAFCA